MEVQRDRSEERTRRKRNKAVLGVAANAVAAEGIMAELKRAGFRTDDLSVLFPDKQGTPEFAYERHTKAPEGAVAGASVGGIVGGTLGLLAGIGALVIPGIGPLFAAGPIMAALGGLGAGAAVGGLSGGLIGLGVPEIEAKVYESELKDGHILLSVHVDDAEWTKRARSILEVCGATNIVTIGEVPRAVDAETKRDRLLDAAIAAQIVPDMPVLSSDGGQFGVVDHVEGADLIRLDRDFTGTHHYIPLSWVTRVDDKVHVDRSGARATREWSTSPSTLTR